ncbi:DLG1 protein, partial [Nycticryphes semicollaris]|nr:DLG1 protein [Nycticryphes semicollaris]
CACSCLDTDRALALLEEYCKKLRKPEEQQLKKAIRKVMGIFKSSLFQALLGSFTKKTTRHGTISHPSLPAAAAYDVLGCPKI